VQQIIDYSSIVIFVTDTRGGNYVEDNVMIIKSFIAQRDSFNKSLQKISGKNVITFK